MPVHVDRPRASADAPLSHIDDAPVQQFAESGDFLPQDLTRPLDPSRLTLEAVAAIAVGQPPELHHKRVEHLAGEHWMVCSCGYHSGPIVYRADAEREPCPFEDAELELQRNRISLRTAMAAARVVESA